MSPSMKTRVAGISGAGAYSAFPKSARTGQTVCASNAPSESATQGVNENDALKVNFAEFVFHALG